MSLLIGAVAGAFLAVAFLYLQNDIHRNYLDPKIPFQIYNPPPAPNYDRSDSWFLNPALAKFYADPRKVDVFFVHGTSYNGGKDWLGSTSSNTIQQEVQRVQLPNYAGPFAIMGNIYAPKYRQASLYTQLTLRDDAREARQFAYHDVLAAFTHFLKTRRGGHGFMIVGVEQGGLLAERLLRDVVVPNPDLRGQLVAAYLLETLAPESQFGNPSPWVPACMSRQQTGCVVSYLSINSGRPDIALQVLQKAVYWQGDGLEGLGSQKGVCVNPLIGAATNEEVDARRSLGATNATDLEWGTEPARIARKVSAHCLGGLLFVDKPKSPSFDDGGTWEEKRKVNPYNLFYGDLQADMQARWLSFQALPKPSVQAKP
ncbi:DUF3089 domain-containing protein [Asticcacaulis sp. 201]|uniref:DUF3089 domain-containing protein n=1 Tax=Asticcacaulis sp. 201 TaxID=3028787 RepID=UPI0029169BF1|nr:DUF3089 domain-containing protein [Asticcacaulis sp. 201]MDV6329391.1 DUF3089 domain-containing protein [Asticcacaulis sp. 201]